MKKHFGMNEFVWLFIAVALISVLWCGTALAYSWDDLSVGGIVTFGHYEQDYDTTNGKEPIEWIVLNKDAENRQITLLSKYELDFQRYNEVDTSVTWETCSLRTWLNNDFLNAAFTANEQAQLATVTVRAEKSPLFDTDPGNDTQDRVYMLSYNEALEYLPSGSDRKVVPSSYAKGLGAYTDSGCGQWWLRSPGRSSNRAIFIATHGGFYENSSYNYNVVTTRIGVRPTIVLSLSNSKKGFDLTRDGWAIQNSSDSFSYPLTYNIPPIRFFESYDLTDMPSIVSLAMRNSINKTLRLDFWGGNCFGLSISSVLNYAKRIDLRKYFSNTDGKDLSEYGYDKKGNGVYALNSGNNAIPIIERLQITWWASQIQQAEVFKTNDYSDKFTKAIRYLNSNLTPLVVYISDKGSAHAIVTDTTITPTTHTDNDEFYYSGSEGFYYIKVYDCNTPYNSASWNGVNQYYKYATERWLLVNPDTGEWRYLIDPVKNEWWGESGHSTADDSNIKFFDVLSVIDTFENVSLRPNTSSDVVYAFVLCTAIDLVTGNDHFIASMKDSITSTLPWLSNCEYSPQNSTSSITSGKIVLPTSSDRISVSDQCNASIFYTSNDHCMYVSTDDESTYEVNVASNSIELDSFDNGTFDIILDNDNGSDYSVINLTGTVSAGTTTITLNEDGVISAESDAENFTADVTVSSSELDEDITFECNDIDLLNNYCLTDGEILRTGTCGDNLTWILDIYGNLTISGTGTMNDYNMTTNLPPWRKNVKTVLVQNGVTSIGAFAFYNSSQLTAITLPDSIANIGIAAFNNCNSLLGITIPDGVTAIANNTFRGCNSLTGITIPESVTDIGILAFYECRSLVNIAIPSSVISIGRAAFAHCSSLTDITIPGSVTIEFDNYVFAYCSNLTNVTISEGVTNIGNLMFHNCTSLTNITIPESVISIGSDAFRDCSSLIDISIPTSVTNINGIGLNLCSSLLRIDVSTGNPELSSEDGIVFNKDKSQLLLYPAGRIGTYTIPESVTTIGVYAFSYCTGLTRITIPDSVIYIDEYAFYNCTGLTSVAIPNSVTGIGVYAFSNCNSLTDITIPDSVTSVGGGAFSHCSSLNSATISTDMTTIAWELFAYCSSLSEITIPASITNVGSAAFLDCNALKTINYGGTWVMKSSISIPYPYGNDPLTTAQWVFINGDGILTLPAGLHQIDSEAFIGLPKFDAVRIPETVTSIADDAFDSGIVVVAPAGSYAASWAAEHGFEVVEE